MSVSGDYLRGIPVYRDRGLSDDVYPSIDIASVTIRQPGLIELPLMES